MTIICDEYKTFLLGLPRNASSSPEIWARMQARWRQAHPEIARLYALHSEPMADKTVDKENEDA